MKAFLKLIRVQNLVIIAFTQYMVRYFLIQPLLQAKGLQLQMNDLDFMLLVLSTLMVAAAGYIINDYFDVNIDKINKPQGTLIDNGVKRRVAILSHTVLNIMAIGLAFYVAKNAGVWKLSVIHLFWATGLWFYSTTFKRQMLIGNLIIALFIVLVPLTAAVYELLVCYKHYYAMGVSISLKELWRYVFMLSFFAGIVTLLREIIKDIEDMNGDKQYGCTTLPIVWGVGNTKAFVVFIALTIMVCLGYLQYFQWIATDKAAFYYFSILLQLPFVFMIVLLIKAQTKKHFSQLGLLAKFIMIAGICYLFLFDHYLSAFAV
jgi:4-hydroxybenzoate polyprenyltransferase